MATEKILNTRIQLKYDTWSNWSNDTVAEKGANLVLKKGEIGICEIPTSTNAGQSTSEPVVLFKVGTYDGENVNTKKAFKDLPWISALAADVHAWAKKPTLDANDLPTIPVAKLPTLPGDKLGITVTVTGSGNAITNASWDAATKTLTLTKGETFATKKEFDEHSHQITATDDDVIIATGGDLSVDVKHKKELGEGKSYTTKESTGVNAFGESATLNIPTLTVNEYGHITAVEDKVVTISLPTPEEVTLPNYTDKAEEGQFVTEVDQSEGQIAVQRKSVDVVYGKDGYIKLAIDGKPIGTGFDAAAFVKDSYLSSAVYKDETNILTLTFIDNEDKLQAIPIDLTDLVDVYSADEVSLTKEGSTFKIKNGGVGTAHIANNAVGTAQVADKAVTKAKLEDSVQASLAKADSALQDITAENLPNQTLPSGLEVVYADEDTKRNAYIYVAQKGIQTVHVADNAIGAKQLKSEQGYSGEDAEVWVFDCGTSTTNI